jgi:hypothetical protein
MKPKQNKEVTSVFPGVHELGKHAIGSNMKRSMVHAYRYPTRVEFAKKGNQLEADLGASNDDQLKLIF